ncbi:hypothetical protein H112_07116 [Trichophyton rubrum D6]|uniref:Uncharacterized protein n=1 Tax=Trichophyton rubrum CBS 288.86 TaxID=1215330 RepID=A0A022VTC4_TRIRU|nr:hypothetical protein H100_07138 [Trichophyton rubrum MR850]EZF38701.1 hypothetical protein H102_07101 [Trichophyton rubrum CBS 100081]EZF49325.1 hypothetical protein H103_07122 [Trichophyton rubrum CBS 288.86]EZF60047.1 hypothetical protein H104_07078 [Trichophyton rubrum CBS 289.86]EZF81260.1 hypothetical protein H110_07122 [Trichophyton rubrum MR1448]EZF92000.1 hypothetical protein H113_07173 [Trichophyton rubrum MR1459]EZG13474.1 hypothetical protein H107_07282 [Trichophyton rubrum CBS 
MDNRPSNYNYGFNIQGEDKTSFLGNNGSFSCTPRGRERQGGNRDGELVDMVDMVDMSLHDGLDCLGDGARSFNHSSFQSPPSWTGCEMDGEDDGETVRFILFGPGRELDILTRTNLRNPSGEYLTSFKRRYGQPPEEPSRTSTWATRL